MAHLIQIPVFQPANPTQITGTEWLAYEMLVNATNFQLQLALTMVVPQYIHPALPPEFLVPPTTPTQRLQAANLVTAHLNTILLQLVVAQHQATLNLAHAQAMPQPGSRRRPQPSTTGRCTGRTHS